MPAEPLQAPELQAPEDIAQALFDPLLAEQAVVSMLASLGIGTYNTDGTPILAGTETSDADFYMFEPEVRGLIDMLESTDNQDEWMTFREFHDALAGLGVQGTAEDLAAAYADSYAADPEAPMSQYVNALTSIDVEGTLPRFTAWLLILDGFVPPHAADLAIAPGPLMAMVGGAIAAPPAPRRGGYGTARTRVGTATSQSQINALLPHLMTMVRASSITITATPPNGHEGHGGGPGSPLSLTAELRRAALQTPFGGLAFGAPGPVGGLPVTWTVDGVLSRHGSLDSAPSATDTYGFGRSSFTPKVEEADGHGIQTTESGMVTATIPAAQMLSQAFNLPPLGRLVPDLIRGTGNLAITWHDPRVMRISLFNQYSVQIRAVIGNYTATGNDTFIGALSEQKDGTWRGIVTGVAVGSGSGQAFGRACTSRWNASQLVEVVGKTVPDQADGNFLLTFKPVERATGNLGSGRCPPTRFKANGFYMAPFNDSRIQATDGGPGMVIRVQSFDPGYHDFYNQPVPTLPPDSGFTVNAHWEIDYEILEPPTP